MNTTKFGTLSMLMIAVFATIFCRAPASFAREERETCRARLEREVELIKVAHQLVTLDIRLVDITDDPAAFVIQVKTFPAADLSGYYAFGSPPDPVFYAEKIRKLFEQTEWQPLAFDTDLIKQHFSKFFPDGRCACPTSPQEWEDQMGALRDALVTWYRWRQATPYWDKFDSSLQFYFKRDWDRIANQFVAESTAKSKQSSCEIKLVIPYERIYALETFTDDSRQTLEFTIHVAAVIWDGTGLTENYADLILEGMARGYYPRDSFFALKFRIDVGKKSREEISSELDKLASEYGRRSAYMLGQMIAHQYGLKEPAPPQLSAQPKPPKPAPVVPPMPPPHVTSPTPRQGIPI